ncbi:hypothetical protein UA08_09017 [Talaromyces atroroseus]|uniref:Uncharacterized protein n=1 Tax=Talaromyces atroroseus TaxID=1441469 RepID=A0A1Q5Q7N6_TALAT|nr:hypothetical protein UA08_09017 [Talaromyces atroroseus]OKL55760.1 hypothetical protein UA08_09017 [Talaromyces atroroseus]
MASLLHAGHAAKMEAYLSLLLATNLNYTTGMSSSELEMQARQKLETEPLRLSLDEPRMIGNSGGFDIFHEIKSLKAELADQKAEYGARFSDQEKNFKNELAMLHGARIRNDMSELIGRTTQKQRYYAYRQERNCEVHGADVEFHRYVLTVPGYDKDMLDACVGFMITYGITPEGYDLHFKEAPKKILQYVNLRGNVYHLFAYTKSSHHQSEISNMQKLCDEIMQLWVSEGKTISEKITAKISEFDQLHQLWQEGEEEEQKKRELQAEKDLKRKNRGKREKGGKRR